MIDIYIKSLKFSIIFPSIICLIMGVLLIIGYADEEIIKKPYIDLMLYLLILCFGWLLGYLIFYLKLSQLKKGNQV